MHKVKVALGMILVDVPAEETAPAPPAKASKANKSTNGTLIEV
jgi:hypothetical protein